MLRSGHFESRVKLKRWESNGENMNTWCNCINFQHFNISTFPTYSTLQLSTFRHVSTVEHVESWNVEQLKQVERLKVDMLNILEKLKCWNVETWYSYNNKHLGSGHLDSQRFNFTRLLRFQLFNISTSWNVEML